MRGGQARGEQFLATVQGPREQGRYAVEFYTTVKTSYVSP